jgi:hypothetical protein
MGIQDAEIKCGHILVLDLKFLFCQHFLGGKIPYIEVIFVLLKTATVQKGTHIKYAFKQKYCT